jgi:hypothetical protein
MPLVAPRSSVLMAGDESVAYVETEDGRFELRPVVLGPIVGDRVVVLDGLKEGEQVAVSGNFLIDSQMQLAGNPSLIDPARAKVKKAKKKPGPLEVEEVDLQLIAGSAGEELERLYQAYFAVQAALAADRAVTEDLSRSLFQAAERVDELAGLQAEPASLARTIAEHAEDLHEQEIEAARVEFKPISKSIILLAARARGEAASTTFLQFYCPMVKGGEGDWLQPAKPLANPYWGARMLRCGRLVREWPPVGSADAKPPLDSTSDQRKPPTAIRDGRSADPAEQSGRAL